jgi:hypothetical protein
MLGLFLLLSGAALAVWAWFRFVPRRARPVVVDTTPSAPAA